MHTCVVCVLVLYAHSCCVFALVGAALAEELARLPKNLNRSLYTVRIMDIIKQVHKQKAEIKRVCLCVWVWVWVSVGVGVYVRSCA